MPCWIHRGAIADAQNVVITQSTRAIIKFIEKRINMLRAQDIDIVCVFDGERLPGIEIQLPGTFCSIICCTANNQYRIV